MFKTFKLHLQQKIKALTKQNTNVFDKKRNGKFAFNWHSLIVSIKAC